jgi:hypothetical protein
MNIGPNVRRLIAHKMSLDAIPPGGGFADAVDFLLLGRLSQSGKTATEWVNQAIRAVKSAPDNPYGDDDETIAGAILARIEEKK